MYYLAEGSADSKEPVFTQLAPSVGGRKTLFFPERGIAKWFYEAGIAEKNVIESGAMFGNPDKIFLDIGAHVGTYAWSLAPKFKHTYAFECNPKVFCYLAANIALQDMADKITPVLVGLGDEAKKVPLIVRSEDGGGNGVKKLKEGEIGTGPDVMIRSLDSFWLSNIGFIKMDVEGFEKEVLIGAKETLRASEYPPILFESWGAWKEKEGVPAMQIRTELFETLIGMGYQIESVEGAQDTFLATVSR